MEVIEQMCSWGTLQNKQVFSRDENTEQPWGLGPSHSHGCAAQGQHVMDGLGLPPFLPRRHGDE